MPKISVIIPVYNVEKYLRQCLDSVVNQTLKDIEIICVDDGSTDNSLAILKEYAAKDDRIIIIEQKNKGAGAARNAGLEVAKGEYLSFLDSDDFFELNMLELMYNKISKDNADICYCNADIYDSKLKKHKALNMLKYNLVAEVPYTQEIIGEDIYNISDVANWNKLYKRSLIADNGIKFQNLTSCNDVYFSYMAVSLANIYTIIPKILVHYRQNTTTSISNNRNKNAINIFYAYKEIVRDLKNRQLFVNIPKIQKRFKCHVKYEISLCNKEEYIKLKNDAKNIIEPEDDSFSELFQTIPVFISTNDAYAKAAATCIASIVLNTNSYVEFFILYKNLNSKNIRKIKQTVETMNNCSVEFVNIAKFTKDFSNFPIIHPFTIDCYYRYLIPIIKPQYDKVIYTDADVIFKGDISEYYNIDLSNYGIAASSDEIGEKRAFFDPWNYENRKAILNINQDHEFFSNGNLLINCAYWRKHNVTQQLIDITKRLSNKLVAPDLDVMNYLFQNNYKRLDYKYCVCVHRYKHTDECVEMINGYNNPFIIHYSGSSKPWNTTNILFYDEWFKYYSKTAYINQKHKNIFSVQNEGIHKVVTILGLKFKFKSKKLVERERFNNLEGRVDYLTRELNSLKEVVKGKI